MSFTLRLLILANANAVPVGRERPAETTLSSIPMATVPQMPDSARSHAMVASVAL